jgi:hypothetical protein
MKIVMGGFGLQGGEKSAIANAGVVATLSLFSQSNGQSSFTPFFVIILEQF